MTEPAAPAGPSAGSPAKDGGADRPAGDHRPLVAVSLKMYFSAARTADWLTAVRQVAERQLRATPPNAGTPELVVLPSFPMLPAAQRLLTGSPVRWGAQGLAPSADGAQTGEVAAAVLAELGCSYVLIGHAEQRASGHGPDRLRAELGQAREHGLTPIVCVGEDAPEPDATPDQAAQHAADFCVGQLRELALQHWTAALVVAYEPVWSIGAERPAAPEHITAVATALQKELATLPARSKLIYGGTAGPGLLPRLAGSVDGLFLGRRAHDPAALSAVLTEVADLTSAPVRSTR